MAGKRHSDGRISLLRAAQSKKSAPTRPRSARRSLPLCLLALGMYLYGE
jgi:hypothetical protein